MSTARDFGVQSYCFREFKNNKDVAAKVREIGVDKVELCGVHANFHQLDTVKEATRIYKDAGVSIISLGVETFKGEANERDIFESAAIAGAKHISCHFQVDTFPKAIPHIQKLSDEFGIRVGIHCHGGYQFGGQPDVLDYLVKLGAPQIGVWIDTAWCIQIGPWQGKPVEWVKRYSGHIYGVHYKDFTFAPSGQWSDVVVGQGNLDLPAFIAALEAENFNGAAVIEYEADAHNPVPALTKCVQAMRSTGKA
jgi:sugar phosphate isomerase/epimerase